MKKEEFKKLRTKLIALALAAGVGCSMNGCGKNSEEKVEEIGYLVECTDLPWQEGLYTYVINLEGLESENYDFDDAVHGIRFAKVNEKEEHGTTLSNDMTTAYYRDSLKMVWPSCFEQYGMNWFNDSNFACTYIVENVSEYEGSSYTIARSSMTVKRDLIPIGKKSAEAKTLKEGDNMSSVAIYYGDELVAYKQTGVGSDCENVIESTVGDVDLALSKVSDLGLLVETKLVDSKELYDLQEELNDNKKIKTLN